MTEPFYAAQGNVECGIRLAPEAVVARAVAGSWTADVTES